MVLETVTSEEARATKSVNCHSLTETLSTIKTFKRNKDVNNKKSGMVNTYIDNYAQ